MKRLEGKVALVIGGASGIGEATARLFAEQGARVVIADIDDQRGKYVSETIGPAAAYRHTDFTQEADIEAVIRYAVDSFGRLDCLSNNAGAAGGYEFQPIEETSIDLFTHAINMCVKGAFLTMKHAAPIMKSRGSGSIITIASVAGLRAGFAPHAYSTAKAAIIQLTRSVAMELGESGVRVNCICPAGIATPLRGRSLGLSDEESRAVSDKLQSLLLKFQPLKRPCLPEDIAQAALWLASDSAAFVNGHTLIVDGGVNCGRLWSAVKQHREKLVAAMGIKKQDT